MHRPRLQKADGAGVSARGIRKVERGLPFSLGLPPARNESWNLPLVLPIFLSKAVNEFPLLEHSHHVSRRHQHKDEDVQPCVVDEQGVGNYADAFERGGRLLKSREVAQDLTDQIDRHHRNPNDHPCKQREQNHRPAQSLQNELSIPRPSSFPGRIIENKPRSP